MLVRQSVPVILPIFYLEIRILRVAAHVDMGPGTGVALLRPEPAARCTKTLDNNSGESDE
jgi:hypothetical protein